MDLLPDHIEKPAVHRGPEELPLLLHSYTMAPHWINACLRSTVQARWFLFYHMKGTWYRYLSVKYFWIWAPWSFKTKSSFWSSTEQCALAIMPFLFSVTFEVLDHLDITYDMRLHCRWLERYVTDNFIRFAALFWWFISEKIVKLIEVISYCGLTKKLANWEYWLKTRISSNWTRLTNAK